MRTPIFGPKKFIIALLLKESGNENEEMEIFGPNLRTEKSFSRIVFESKKMLLKFEVLEIFVPNKKPKLWKWKFLIK